MLNEILELLISKSSEYILLMNDTMKVYDLVNEFLHTVYKEVKANLKLGKKIVESIQMNKLFDTIETSLNQCNLNILESFLKEVKLVTNGAFWKSKQFRLMIGKILLL